MVDIDTIEELDLELFPQAFVDLFRGTSKSYRLPENISDRLTPIEDYETNKQVIKKSFKPELENDILGSEEYRIQENQKKRVVITGRKRYLLDKARKIQEVAILTIVGKPKYLTGKIDLLVVDTVGTQAKFNPHEYGSGSVFQELYKRAKSNDVGARMDSGGNLTPYGATGLNIGQILFLVNRGTEERYPYPTIPVEDGERAFIQKVYNMLYVNPKPENSRKDFNKPNKLIIKHKNLTNFI